MSNHTDPNTRTAAQNVKAALKHYGYSASETCARSQARHRAIVRSTHPHVKVDALERCLSGRGLQVENKGSYLVVEA